MCAPVAAVGAPVAGVSLYSLPTMDPSTAPVSPEESPDSHPRTSSRLDRADLVELIGNIVRGEITSHSSCAAGVSHCGGEFRDEVLG